MNPATAAFVRLAFTGVIACFAGCAQVFPPSTTSPASPSSFVLRESTAPAPVSSQPSAAKTPPPASESPVSESPASVLLLLGNAPIREAVPAPAPTSAPTYDAQDAARRAKQTREIADVRQRYVDAHPELPEAVRLAILTEKVIPGMTQETAFVALGAPNRATRNVNAEGTTEQWIFPGRTLNFEKGILINYTEEH